MNVKHNLLLKGLRDFGVGPIVGLFISLFTVPVVTRLISPEQFGKSSLFTLLYTIFNLIALLGIDQAFVRYFNVEGINRKTLLYNSVILPFVLCVIIIIGIIVFYRQLSFWLFNQYEPLIIILLCFFLPLLILNRFSMLIIRMELRGKLYSILNIASQIVNFFCLLLFLFLYEKSFRSIIYGTVLAEFINTAIAVFFMRKDWNLTDSCIDKILLSQLLQFGLPLVPATVLFWIMSSFDRIGLKQWSTYEQIGLYAASFKIVSLLNIIQSIFTTVWVPVAYKWYEEQMHRKYFEEVHDIVLAFLCVGFSLIVLFRKIFVMILGEAYSESSAIMVYLLFVPVMYTLSSAMAIGIDMAKQTKYNLYVIGICACINIIGNYVLIPLLGAKGAAISTAVSYIAFFFLRVYFSGKVWIRFPIKMVSFEMTFLIILVLCVELSLPMFVEIFIFLVVIFTNFSKIKKHLNVSVIKNISSDL
jgi:O-antigen/teichoic acid export membrane protein